MLCSVQMWIMACMCPPLWYHTDTASLSPPTPRRTCTCTHWSCANFHLVTSTRISCMSCCSFVALWVLLFFVLLWWSGLLKMMLQLRDIFNGYQNRRVLFIPKSTSPALPPAGRACHYPVGKASISSSGLFCEVPCQWSPGSIFMLIVLASSMST